MHLLRKQHTIASPVDLTGFGYWSGQDVNVQFRPASPDSGIVFVRGDAANPIRIPATIQHRVETPRRTTLAKAGSRVEMVEHIMAALVGLQIDNCEVWVDRPEMPGMDGSSQAFVDTLLSAGVVEQPASRPMLIVREITRLGDDDAWIEVRPLATGSGLLVRYRLDYGKDNAIGRQTLELKITPEVFRRELASSRTFLFQQEAQWLLSQGLGTRVTPGDLLIFGSEGPVDNELRYEDECVRHKMLDLIGDLALVGCDLMGQVIAHRSGHRLNAEMARILMSEGELIQPRKRSA